MSNKKDLPKYVTLNDSALRLVGNCYYRDAGEWSVEVRRYENGVIKSYNPAYVAIHNVELLKTTKSNWKKSNRGYIPDNI